MTSDMNVALRDSFLQGMSLAACTVNVVTTEGPGGRAGATVSAMASVSADTPAPALLVCLHHKSATCEAILANGVFCVNVLREDQAHISDIFAGRRGGMTADKFRCSDWVTGKTGAPRLADPLAAFDCRLMLSHRVGSHMVMFGSVEEIALSEAGRPLVYASRAYATLVPPQVSLSHPWRAQGKRA